MLTSFQASPIAYWPLDGEYDDGPVCPDCADREAGGRTAQDEGQDVDELMIHYYGTPAGFQPSSRYAVEDRYPEGIDCVRCGAVIVEPEEDYCQAHDAWYAGTSTDDAGDDFRYCEDADTSNVEDGIDTCLFPDTDPNPPVPRWVPCGSCGAGDGEPHRDGCIQVR
jgi:hypothetical protein